MHSFEAKVWTHGVSGRHSRFRGPLVIHHVSPHGLTTHESIQKQAVVKVGIHGVTGTFVWSSNFGAVFLLTVIGVDQVQLSTIDLIYLFNWCRHHMFEQTLKRWGQDSTNQLSDYNWNDLSLSLRLRLRLRLGESLSECHLRVLVWLWQFDCNWSFLAKEESHCRCLVKEALHLFLLFSIRAYTGVCMTKTAFS